MDLEGKVSKEAQRWYRNEWAEDPKGACRISLGAALPSPVGIEVKYDLLPSTPVLLLIP